MKTEDSRIQGVKGIQNYHFEISNEQGIKTKTFSMLIANFVIFIEHFQGRLNVLLES